MTKEQWKTLRNIRYTSYTILDHTFSWEAVERIGALWMYPRSRKAGFTIFFKSGKEFEVHDPDWVLDPEYETRPSWFGSRQIVSTDPYYYAKHSDQMKEVLREKRLADSAFLNFKQIYLRKGR
jgi:hypothetical protein